MVSVAGKKMPVLVSPDVVMAGAAAEPACTVVTPVADNVVNAPVEAVVAPTVPVRGPVKPVAASAPVMVSPDLATKSVPDT